MWAQVKDESCTANNKNQKNILECEHYKISDETTLTMCQPKEADMPAAQKKRWREKIEEPTDVMEAIIIEHKKNGFPCHWM